MTLVVTINGPETIWLLADRRLSRKGQAPQDDGRKLMVLETADGVAILGYAGLAATATGNEPGDWMSGVLRRRNLPLEQSLLVLAEAMNRELPRHIRGLPVECQGHTVLIPAFLGGQPKFYAIVPVLTADRMPVFRCTDCGSEHAYRMSRREPPPFSFGGSGIQRLNEDGKWYREMLRLARACDRRKVGQIAVADHLAGLNLLVHRDDPSVSARSIVIWRNRKGGVHGGGGGGMCYDGISLDPRSSKGVPLISCGMDMQGFFDAIREGDRRPREPGVLGTDHRTIQDALARLSKEPDEKLV